MKLVLTLLVRNEADIIDANIAYHLNAGVDFVIATDNESDDGTTEILEAYEREGHLHLIREPGDDVLQEYWVTDMARLAAEFGADWVINSDADEFWWSREAPLKEILARIPRRFATVRAFLRNFVPCAGGDVFFAERMTARLVPWKLDSDSRFHRHPYHPQDKVLHRGHPAVAISGGNHDARWDGSIDLRGWWPVEVLHFPIRSEAQAANKRRNWTRHRYGPLDELVVGTSREYYESLVVNEDERGRGLAEGWLVEDTRIRDALRQLRRDPADATRRFELPAAGRARPDFSATTMLEDAMFAADVSAGVALDSVARAERSLERLEARIAELQHPLVRRAVRTISSWPGARAAGGST